jgi:hypothetical protein
LERTIRASGRLDVRIASFFPFETFTSVVASVERKLRAASPEDHSMKPFIWTTSVVTFLLTGGSVVAAQTHVSVGIQIGPPPPPRVVYVAPPPAEPEYLWVEGYWYPVQRHYVWHDGYWTRPPYRGARWVAARYDGRAFFEGYWDGPRGRIEHDHHWDRDHDRDRYYETHDRRGPGKGHGKGR